MTEDEIKERKLMNLLDGLNEIVFIKSTNSVTGEEEDMENDIKDMEGTILIKGEFDREDIKSLLHIITS